MQPLSLYDLFRKSNSDALVDVLNIQVESIMRVDFDTSADRLYVMFWKKYRELLNNFKPNGFHFTAQSKPKENIFSSQR